MNQEHIDELLGDKAAREYIIGKLAEDPSSGYTDPVMQIKMISRHPDAIPYLRAAYQKALDAVNGNRTMLATVAGMARETLRTHLIRLGLQEYRNRQREKAEPGS